MEPSQDDTARRARWPEKLAVGRVVKAHGVRGEVVIEVWGELGALREESELWLGGKHQRLVNLRGSESRPIGSFEDCTDRDLAESLRGKVLEVRSSVLSTPTGSDLYLFELQGCAVSVMVSPKNEGHALKPRSLGTVRRVVEDGGGLLLEVTENEPDGASPVFLVPFVKAYLRTQDLNAGQLVFDLPEGLLETCVSTS